MKILHWYPNFLHGGGIANAVQGLAGAQAELGHRVLIAAAAGSVRPMYEAGPTSTPAEVMAWQPSRTLRVARQYVRIAARRSLTALRSVEPDIVHVHGEYIFDNLRVARLFACPVVISPHGACHPVVLWKSRPRAKRVFFALEGLLLSRHVKAFHALSPAEVGHIAALFPKAVCYCVPQGGSVLVSQELSRRPRPAPADGAIRFLFVGRLDVFTKGLDVLLDAFHLAKRLSGDRPMHLMLVGPDWNGGRTWLEERAQRLGIRQAVEFVGAVTGGGVAGALANADVYVHLSRHEGFALSVAEALLARKPAVLSGAIGTTTYPLIATSPHVRVVNPVRDEAAAAMLEMAEHLATLTAAAQRHDLAEFFSWDRIASAHVDRYRELSCRWTGAAPRPQPYPISAPGAGASSGV